METQENSKIFKYLLNSNTTNLEISDELTNRILEFDYINKYPGISLKYLESKKRDEELGTWNEYNILFSILKYKDTSDYLGYSLGKLGDLIKDIGKDDISIDVIGVQEMECSEPDCYYILLYILSDGKEKEIAFDY